MADDSATGYTGSELASKRVGFLVANEGVEQAELTGPWEALRAAGAECVLIAPEGGEVQAFNHLDKADTFPVDKTSDEVSPGELDVLVLPGGVANPDALRQDETSVDLLRAFFDTGRTVALICHAPWMLVEAGLVSGRTVTSWPSLRTDIVNAGGHWVDEQVVVDGQLITSRKPDDIPAFSRAIVEQASGQARAA